MQHCGQSILNGFSAWAERTPGAPALEIADTFFSYSELAERARRLASALPESEQLIGVFGGKSVDTYAAILGCLYSGNAFVPLDPTLPPARLGKIIRDAGLKTIFHARGWNPDPEVSQHIRWLNCESWQEFPEIPAPIPVEARWPAYLLYTSGSSGTPKGVLVRHENATAFLQWCSSYFQFEPGERFSAHADPSFDLSIFDMFACWDSGGCLVPLATAGDKALSGKFIQAKKISVWLSVPSVLQQLGRLGQLNREYLGSLKYALFAGETPPIREIRELSAACPDLRIFNLYGPTEATVACSCWEFENFREDRVPIGWNTGSTRIHLLHGDRPTQPGETGEIYITGPQVVNRYWNNPEESEIRFVAFPPSAETKAFRTGDYALHTKDGPVFLGRRDQQVKFRGYRIEIGEIEAALASAEGIAECAVALKKTEGKPDELIAFAGSQGSPPTSSELKAHLRRSLPNYFIPTKFHFLPKIPRTANGKIDRKRIQELAENS